MITTLYCTRCGYGYDVTEAVPLPAECQGCRKPVVWTTTQPALRWSQDDKNFLRDYHIRSDD